MDGMPVHVSKSSVIHSVPEGVFSSLLVFQSVKPSVLEIFLLIIQVFERLVNLSTAIHFPDSVRKMRESCPGLTEQTPKGLTERSEVFQYDRMHECCALSKSSKYIQSRTYLFSAIKMGLYTHFGMQQRSSYSIVRLNM